MKFVLGQPVAEVIDAVPAVGAPEQPAPPI